MLNEKEEEISRLRGKLKEMEHETLKWKNIVHIVEVLKEASNDQGHHEYEIHPL